MNRSLPSTHSSSPPSSAVALVAASSAFAHARVSPPVSLASELQLYSLAVPTEKEDATTTKIVLTRARRASRSTRSSPSPGWHRVGPADRLRRGRRDPEGHLDRRQRPDRRGLDASSSSASRRRAATYTFQVEQTYSDGSIVNWDGSESSEDPAPTIEAKSSLGGGGTLAARDRRARRSAPSASSLGARRPRSPAAGKRPARVTASGGRLFVALVAPWRRSRCRPPRRRTPT